MIHTNPPHNLEKWLQIKLDLLTVLFFLYKYNTTILCQIPELVFYKVYHLNQFAIEKLITELNYPFFFFFFFVVPFYDILFFVFARNYKIKPSNPKQSEL